MNILIKETGELRSLSRSLIGTTVRNTQNN